MHTFGETGAGVPAFLAKLWRLVEDPGTNNLICWSKDGRSFIIQNQAQFARELLPLNYKHNNMASFIRQLNMYGFHKITSIDNGGLKFDRDEMEFSHPCFKRNHPYLLEHIKRKIANTKAIDDKTSVKSEAVSKVLNDVKVMRGRQDSLDSRFSVMKQENEALWREIASLRQKHAKQQQIINKLIQFLITIVQPSRNMTSVKRNMQLMINDNVECKKIRNTSESESDCGPIIHELGEELLDEVTSDADLVEDPSSPYYNLPSSRYENESPTSLLNPDRPQSNASAISQNYDYSQQNASCASPGGSSIINAINPDGSQIVYHVTEVPDNHLIDSKISIASSSSNSSSSNSKKCPDDNILTTPMVKEAMARGQLKNKNKQRRKLDVTSFKSIDKTDNKIMNDNVENNDVDDDENISKANKLVKFNKNETFNPIKIKTETTNEIDPSIFLNFNYPTQVNDVNVNLISHNLNSNQNQNVNENIQMDPRVILPDPTEDSRHSNELNETEETNDMYQTIFDSYDIPTELFEDPMLIDESNYKNAKSQSQQINLSLAPVSSSPSASSSSTSSTSDNSNAVPVSNGNEKKITSQPNASRGKNMKTLALTKYSPNKSGYESEREEITNQVEGVQDELDSLKDLLRSDEYSIDANTLLSQIGSGTNNRVFLNQAVDCGDLLQKLFSDSDILGPYGLQVISNDSSQEKKGSEVMTYQPIYDLSDIIDINDENEIEDERTANKASSSKRIQPPDSNLNTPYHE